MDVTVGWVMLAVIGWALGMLLILVLCQMAGRQDRDARHGEKKLIPFSDVTITRFGNS